MASYTWTGATDGESFNKAGNYSPSGVPGPLDTLTIPNTFEYVEFLGISNAGIVINDGGIAGGQWEGSLTNNTSGTIYDGTFNGSVNNKQDIQGGNFFGDVTSTGTIGDGTFHGSVTVSPYGMIDFGTFYGPVTSLFCDVGSAIFYDDLLINSAALWGGTFHHRISMDGGFSWIYSPDSPAVAAAADVRSGASNLGVAGTLNVPGATATMGIGM